MKITREEYLKWLNIFDNEKSLRAGQSFCNHFNITESDLFYESDNMKAMNKIMREFVKMD